MSADGSGKMAIVSGGWQKQRTVDRWQDRFISTRTCVAAADRRDAGANRHRSVVIEGGSHEPWHENRRPQRTGALAAAKAGWYQPHERAIGFECARPLKPHCEDFKLSNDKRLSRRFQDVVGLLSRSAGQSIVSRSTKRANQGA